MIDFALTKKQQELKEGLNGLGRYVIRPMSLEMDRNHEVPEHFLRNFMNMAKGIRSDDVGDFTEGGVATPAKASTKLSHANRTAAVGAEELAWADAAMLLCMPGPGLGAPPVRGTGTPEQKKRFFSSVLQMLRETLLISMDSADKGTSQLKMAQQEGKSSSVVPCFA